MELPAVDPFAEDLEPLSDLIKALPAKRISPCTVWRWKTKGKRGIRLPFINIAGVDYSQRSLFAEWLRLTSAPSPRVGRSAHTARILDELGLTR